MPVLLLLLLLLPAAAADAATAAAAATAVDATTALSLLLMLLRFCRCCLSPLLFCVSCSRDGRTEIRQLFIKKCTHHSYFVFFLSIHLHV